MADASSPVSLYIHIPFCVTRCVYCAFNTYVNLDALIEPFVQALIREIAILGTSRPQQAVETIFFGGGTPSLLLSEQVYRITAAVRQHFAVQDSAEITLEANPDDLSFAYLAALRDVGINRLSVGMQSANAKELNLFQRRHNHEMTIQAVLAARRAGFDNLNLDLIYGIPMQTLADWKKSLQEAFSLQPEHISLYALGVEDDTPLQAAVAAGRFPQPEDDDVADMYDLATDLLGSAGYSQYEISNWSKPGHQCRHNLQYWRNLPYAGVGPGAHGFAAGIRYSTVLLPQKYIRLIQGWAGKNYRFPYTPATDIAVIVDRANEIAETLIMGLRLTQEGIQREVFLRRFGVDVLDVQGAALRKYADYGLLDVDSERVHLTQKGRLLSNMIFRDLVVV